MNWIYLASLALLVAISSAIELQHESLIRSYTAPAILRRPLTLKTEQIEEDGPPEYDFSYSVHDPKTGDIKSQKESRKGDRVEGSYELIDSDGHRRLVQYTADDQNGFQAIVHREPTDIKIPEPAVQQPKRLLLAAQSPIIQYVSQPRQPLITKISVGPLESNRVQERRGNEDVDSGNSNHVSFSGPAVSYSY